MARGLDSSNTGSGYNSSNTWVEPPHTDPPDPNIDSAEVIALKAEIKRLRQGYGKELNDTEAELAPALGYIYDTDYGWVTGDHTTVSLAMEARSKIERLSRYHNILHGALAELVRLHDGPRDDFYQELKEAAWERARLTLKTVS